MAHFSQQKLFFNPFAFAQFVCTPLRFWEHISDTLLLLWFRAPSNADETYASTEEVVITIPMLHIQTQLPLLHLHTSDCHWSRHINAFISSLLLYPLSKEEMTNFPILIPPLRFVPKMSGFDADAVTADVTQSHFNNRPNLTVDEEIGANLFVVL